jgi:hypothetical protein
VCSLRRAKKGKRVQTDYPNREESYMYIGVGTILLIILIILLIAFVF